MPRRKQARRTDVKDMRSILRLTYGQGLSVRAVSERLKLSKTTVSTYVLRAREAGLASWPLPPGQDDDAELERLLFRRVGRPPQDLTEPDWALIAREIKRKGVTLTLLWQEYRAARSRMRTSVYSSSSIACVSIIGDAASRHVIGLRSTPTPPRPSLLLRFPASGQYRGEFWTVIDRQFV
jgi:transposase